MTPRTFKDLVPLLENVNRDINFSRIAKSDFPVRHRLIKKVNELNALNIEEIVIESIALGNTGIVLATTLRNTISQILERIKLIRELNPMADRGEPNPQAAFDRYQEEMLKKPIADFQLCYSLYKGHKKVAMIPEDAKQSLTGNARMVYERAVSEIDMRRQQYIKAKSHLLALLQQSVEFEKDLDAACRPQLRRIEIICNKIDRVIVKYYNHLPPMVTTITDGDSDNDKHGIDVNRWDMELFPIALVSDLFEVCSEVFDSTETQFHSSLNLHCKHEPIKIRPKQKIKACYLISKLYDILPVKHKAAWRDDILAHLDIQWSYYEKKYCHPRGDDASVSSKEYADEIDRIFKKHKKRA